MKENTKDAYLFAYWYIENKQYLKNILMKNYAFDEDVLSDVFFSIYNRILNKGIQIKDYKSYVLKACKYKHITYREKANRLVLVEDYNQLQNIYTYEI